MSYNSIILSLTDQSVASILQHIAAIRAELPRAISLNKEAKAKLAKMGKKRLFWSKDAFDYAQQYPLLLPQNRTLQLWAQVKRDYDYLGIIMKQLAILVRVVQDLFTKLGADYYAFALGFYDEVKAAGNDGEPGIMVVLEDLKKQFEGQGLNNEPDPTDDPLNGDNNATGTNDNPTDGGGSPTDGGGVPV